MVNNEGKRKKGVGVKIVEEKLMVDSLLKKYEAVSYIWVKEKTERTLVGVYDIGDGVMRKVTFNRTGNEFGGKIPMVLVYNGVTVISGRTEEAMREVKRLWARNKKMGKSLLEALRSKYSKSDIGVKRIKRIHTEALRLRKEKMVEQVAASETEVHVIKNNIQYVFGVNYGVALVDGKEVELFEFVPHKESMLGAEEKCKGLKIGVWIRTILHAYDLRRK